MTSNQQPKESKMKPNCDIKPECYDRLTVDECGNITAIDGIAMAEQWLAERGLGVYAVREE
jgi:hypothetical protein